MIGACAAAITLFVIGMVIVTIALTGRDERDTSTAQQQTSAETLSGRDPAAAAISATDTLPATGKAPTLRTRKVLKLADHPLLRSDYVTLPYGGCQLPPWQHTRTATWKFFRAATNCLNGAWAPLLRSHNLPFAPPKLNFPTGKSFDSKCGRIQIGLATAAYYCKGELFLPFRGLQIKQYKDSPGVYLALVAHEYGHHAQQLAGIMDAVSEKIRQVGKTSPDGREMSRRKELQAQCFSGLFIGSHVAQGGSITREMHDQAWYDQERRGDDTSGGNEHGRNKNYARWWRIGAVANRISACNTFAASANAVR